MNLRALAGHVPAALSFLLLGSLAVWGHRSGWRLAPPAEAAAEAEDWCPTHGVPQSRCLACNPALGGGDPADWCREHGVPESRCTTCHPELLTTGKADDWCREHGVPESQCTTCHPEVAAIDSSAAPPPDVRVVGAPDRTRTCQTHVVRIQFASPGAVRKAGVTLVAAARRPMSDRVRAPGEAAYDRARLARLAPRSGGTIVAVAVEVGDRVHAGQTLAVVDAVEVGRARSALLDAVGEADVCERRFARLGRASQEGVVNRGTFEDAEAAARQAAVRLCNAEQALANLGLAVRAADLQGRSGAEAAERLRLLGLPGDAVALVGSGTATATLIPVLAPFDGTVIARDAARGELADPARPIVTVADVGHMRVTLQVPAEDQERLALGQDLAFRPDGAGFVVQGRVSFIATAVDPTTRTLPVQAVVDNADGRLRASTFGAGWVTVRDAPEAVVVPDGAVHWEGCHHVVFVRLTDEVFQTRKVTLGARENGLTEVHAGVLAGEVVADRGSHVLLSELLKSKLGAGCCAE